MMNKFLLYSQENKSYIWKHLDLNNKEAIEYLENITFSDPLIFQALTQEDPRPRFEQINNGMLLILRAINTNKDAEPEEMVSIRVWIEKEKILSAQKHNVKAINEVSSLFSKQMGPKTSGEFIVELCYNIIYRTEEIVDKIVEDTLDLENIVLENNSYENYNIRSEILNIRKRIISFRKYLVPQREAVNKIKNSNTSILSLKDKNNFREISEKINKIIEELDYANQRANIIYEELKTAISEKSSKTIYILSLITAIFLPLSFIASLLGINVGGIPGATYKWAFFIVCLILFLISIIIIIIFKKNKWL